MPAFRSFLLLIALLLMAVGSRAQGTTPAPPPAGPQELELRVTVPTVVAVVGDYAGTLFSRQKNKLKALAAPRPLRTSNPVIVFTVPLPKGWGPKKEKNPTP